MPDPGAPIFGRSINPIPTRGGRFCPPFPTGSPKFFHLPASLPKRTKFTSVNQTDRTKLRVNTNRSIFITSIQLPAALQLRSYQRVSCLDYFVCNQTMVVLQSRYNRDVHVRPRMSGFDILKEKVDTYSTPSYSGDGNFDGLQKRQ